ncbi:MAG: class I SAM-dependent RNA methyltransferase [Lachnospiraceae bacterium]|nr:class I SAM-dependent RNA methyltransferase [Lachnospiraceae bacterium]
MKKGQIIEGIVERMDFPNKGIVICGEGVCTVKNALLGQKVRAAVNKARNGRYEGRLLEVLEHSPVETGSPCPHFGSCGGCTYLSFPYEESLKIKEGQVRRLLAPVLEKQDGECLFETVKASPAVFGYRNKMEFTFGDEVKDGPLSLGMHKRGSFYDIVSVTDCQIVEEDYRKILRCVRDYFSGLREQGMDVSFYHRLRHTGWLRHLVVRRAAKTGEILVALVTTSQVPVSQTAGGVIHGQDAAKWQDAQDGLQESDGVRGRNAGEQRRGVDGQERSASEEGIGERELLAGLRDRLLALPLDGRIVGFLHVRNDSAADVVQSDGTAVLYGRDYFYEELLGLRFKISLFSFFQTNSLGAELLYSIAREYISGYISSSAGAADGTGKKTAQGTADEAGREEMDEPVRGKIVYDLYSGTGTIAQLMAPVAKKVIGVEIVEEAVEAARKNAALNGLHNCEFIAGDVLKVLDGIAEKPDVIILDPPRDGVHPKALTKIIDYGVEHILYISCKASSLARDLEVFLARGYRAERCVAVDQFPWTAGVETVVLLSQLKPDDYIDAELDFSHTPFYLSVSP